jgi:hypothetical protein
MNRDLRSRLRRIEQGAAERRARAVQVARAGEGKRLPTPAEMATAWERYCPQLVANPSQAMTALAAWFPPPKAMPKRDARSRPR